jgi:DNA invertase Pin-like site-specific DNA recombinase
MPKPKPRPAMDSAPQKGCSKPKCGIPLDGLLAAHAVGKDARLERLVRRYGREVVPASQMVNGARASKKQPSAAARVRRPDDSRTIAERDARLVGYARVSMDDQTTALQSDALSRAGVESLFQEEASGANAARPVLAEALASVGAGDTLVVWRLDRLGRSLGHLIEIATELRERGVFLRSLTEGFDTSTASGRLLYHVLGAVAEFEREVIKERTVAGMKAAKKRGAHVGRPNVLAGSRLEEARRMLAEGKSQVEAARILRVSRATIQRALAA